MQIVLQQEHIRKEKRKVYQLLHSGIPVFIFGTTYKFELEQTIRGLEEKAINIEGIIDDFTEKKEVNGLRVFRLNDISKDSMVISTVTQNKLWVVLELLEQKGFSNKLTYWDLCLMEPKTFKLPPFFENNEPDITENQDKYVLLYNSLYDLESRNILENLIDFRLNLNIDSLKPFKRICTNQYFEEFIPYDKIDSFVDCGGYQGETTIDFIKRVPNYKKVYYFEPSFKNMMISKENLSIYTNIKYFMAGTYSDNTVLKFNSDEGSSSAITNEGTNEIEVLKLDDVITDENLFIKMDIEGAELDSLIGAKNIIVEKKPVLAICVYHDQRHFWKIPEFIKGIREDYKIYIRHYSGGNFETVMYFI
ncbi:FkbM family methyltransferase [Bacillaceae bacterium CLA-AA-H227]|uniref:FkbM family methyltransferase n=1 Tax=Robertmurraya yapensis (ex Hitch et al 2024) TaxID=3133160 RepID=A0ACC6SBQ4_9BACI